MMRRLGLGYVALAMSTWILTACPEEPTTNQGARRGTLVLSSTDANGNDNDIIPADGVSYLLIQVITRDADGKPFSGNVDLSTDLGSFAAAVPTNSVTVSTDAEGKASVQFICAKPQSGDPEQPGAGAITARNSQASARAQVYCAEVPDNSSLTLTIEGSEPYYADGATPLTLTAALTDVNGEARGGAEVVFETMDASQHLDDNGSLVASLRELTNNDGQAQAIVRAPASPLVLRIKASWTDGTATLEDEVTISYSADQSGISLTADRSSAPADGSVAVGLTATALGYDGQPVADNVDITFGVSSPYGFGSAVDTSTTVQTTGGAGEASASLNATLTQGTAVITAEFEVSPGQKRRSLPVSVEFVEPGQILLEIVADPPEFFTDSQESSVLTVTATRDGTPMSAQSLSFSLNNQDAAIATFGVDALPQVDRITDPDGIASAELRGLVPGAAGSVTVTVSTVDSQNGNATVSQTQTVLLKRHPLLQSVLFVSADPALLGTRGSPRQSTAVVTFQALDDNNVPMEGVNFRFLRPITIDPTVVITTTGGGDTAVSDSTGSVIAYLAAGTQAHPVRVIAQATDPNNPNIIVTVTSDPIPITSGLTSWSHSWFECDDASETMLPPGTRSCSASLADRFSERVPGGTSVQLRVESGNITPTSTVSDDGSAGGISYLTGEPPPSDTTDSFGALGTLNPTDNLIAMLAYTRGEEPFTDVNGNGVYDLGEPFVDFPEPFVDKQDNCQRNDATDPSDNLYIDPSIYPGGEADPYMVMLNTDPFVDGNNDGVWNGPNATWDDDALLWFQERTLLVYPAVDFQVVDADCADSPIPNQSGYPDNSNPAHVAYRARCQPGQDARYNPSTGNWEPFSHIPWISAGDRINLRFRAYDAYGNCAAPGKGASYTWSADNAEGNGTLANGPYGCGLGGETAVDPVSGHLQPYCTIYRNAEVDNALRVTTPGLGALPFSGSFDTGASQVGQPIKITVVFSGESFGGSLTLEQNLTYVIPCRDDAECGATYVDTDGGQVLAEGSATCDMDTGMCITP